ncbi:uncharacterized protein LOC141812686 [Curcuma longa]|uniref:uncharacterized protein LOC141812686 n=1 Tax=Curcuma longa TaxID=136217 RepID=UPI003D9E84BB
MLNSNSYLNNSPGREKHWNSADRMSVEPREGTRRQSTGPTIAGGPLFSSDSHRKSLPTHLRNPKASCHDYCKYGIKYVTEDGSKGFATESLGEEMQHKGLRQVNNLDLEETRNAHTKTSRNLDKPNAIKESRWMKESINFERTAAVQQTIARVASRSEDKSEPKTKYQAKEPAFRLNKAYSAGKHNILKKTSTKSSNKAYESHRFKQTASLLTKRIDTITYLAKANTIPVRIESRSTIHSSNSSRNESYKRRNIRGMPGMVEETVKSQMSSHSYNHADNDELCLEAMNNNQEFQMVKPDEENNEDKTTAIRPKVDSNSDGLEQRSNKENYGFVSVTQMSWKLEGILDSSQPESPQSESVDFSLVKLGSPMEEENYPNGIERESSNDWPSHSLAYDEETEESHSAITELTGPEDETEETETGSDTKIDESDSAISEFSELEYETERIKSGSDSETSMFRRRRLKQSACVHPEENLSVPSMLKFRRRIPHQVESDNCAQVGRKDFLQMPRVEVLSDLDPEAAAFGLRRQDVLEKDLRGLFNNVIEETASKLAQNRNSKVQALVRAFETVISLHSPK